MLCFGIVHLTGGEHPRALGPPASVLCSEKQTNGAHCPLFTGQCNRCTLSTFSWTEGAAHNANTEAPGPL